MLSSSTRYACSVRSPSRAPTATSTLEGASHDCCSRCLSRPPVDCLDRAVDRRIVGRRTSGHRPQDSASPHLESPAKSRYTVPAPDYSRPATDIDPVRMSIDTVRFEAELVRGTTLVESSPAEAGDALATALQMWTGPPYADVADQEAIRPEAMRLTELRLTRYRATHRRRSPGRSSRRRARRTGDAHDRAPIPRAAACAADAGLVPLRASDGGIASI